MVEKAGSSRRKKRDDGRCGRWIMSALATEEVGLKDAQPRPRVAPPVPRPSGAGSPEALSPAGSKFGRGHRHDLYHGHKEQPGLTNAECDGNPHGAHS